MPDQNDILVDLRAQRSQLYAQLQIMDDRVADVQRSPFFATVPGNAYTIRKSIERVERQISDVDRKIAAIHGPAA